MDVDIMLLLNPPSGEAVQEFIHAGLVCVLSPGNSSWPVPT